METCLEWLISCGAQGLANFDIKRSQSCGAGCFAKKDFEVGELLFSIPQKCIFSLNNTEGTNLTKLLCHYASVVSETDLITLELLIWLHMCESRNSAHHEHAKYFQSLDTIAPTATNWDDNEAYYLQGTNLGKTLSSSMARIDAQAQLMDKIRSYATACCSDLTASNICDVEFLANLSTTFPYKNIDILWAMGHYFSRRYPGKFSVPSTDNSSTSALQREPDVGNIGALVPFLDILNHNPDREWLKFRLDNGSLKVLCNYPVHKGDEVYSNYGALSNEMLLYAYGFALPDNPHDSVSIKLAVSYDRQQQQHQQHLHHSECTGQEENVDADPIRRCGGVFYIRSGGVIGVPKELWGTISLLLGNDQDGLDDIDDNSDRELEGSEDRQLQIGFDEALMLRDWTARQLQLLTVDIETQDCVERSHHQLVEAENVTEPGVSTITRKRKVVSLSDATGCDREIESKHHYSEMTTSYHFRSLRRGYCECYRKGQIGILTELLVELEEVLSQCEDESCEEDGAASGNEDRESNA